MWKTPRAKWQILITANAAFIIFPFLVYAWHVRGADEIPLSNLESGGADSFIIVLGNASLLAIVSALLVSLALAYVLRSYAGPVDLLPRVRISRRTVVAELVTGLALVLGAYAGYRLTRDGDSEFVIPLVLLLYVVLVVRATVYGRK